MAEGLSRLDPCVDPSRARQGGDHVLEDDRLVLATDFECGNGCRPRREGAAYALDLEPEPGHHRFSGKSYYFCCGLQNRTGRPLDVRLRLYANMDGKIAEGTRSAVLRCAGQWDLLPPDRIRPVAGADAVELTLTLPAGDAPLFVGNFHWHPFSELSRWVDGLRADPLARVSIPARSPGGRPVYRIDLGRQDAGAPTVVMCQTPQPSEGTGTHVCRAIVGWLLADTPDASAIRDAHRLIVLPATNPDGTVLGLGVSHPSGRFPFFEGTLTADGGPGALPEMQAVWHTLASERPWWFIDWHSNNWDRRPGHMLLRYRPRLLADPRPRSLWETIDQSLLALPDTYHGNWTDRDEGMYQDALGFQAATRLGAIAHMIKHHDKHTLESICRHALACLKAGLAAHDGRPPS